MAVSTCEGSFLARARKSDSRRCHVSTNVWKTCVFTTTRLHTPRRAAHEHPDLRIPRDAPSMEVMTSAFPRVWLATTPRASNAARKGRRQPPTDVVPLHAFQDDHVLGRRRSDVRVSIPRARPPSTVPVSETRGRPTRYLSISSPRTTSACSRYHAAASLRERPGQLYRKISRAPRPARFPRISEPPTNITICHLNPRSSWLTDHLLDPLHQAISRAVADSGYNITSIITGRTPAPDPTVGFITLHAAPRRGGANPSPLEARATGNDVSPRASTPDTSRDILLRALARLPR